GPRLRREIPLPLPLSADEFEHALRGGALIIDVRSKEEYAEGHIPNAIHIAFGDTYATWLGWLVPPEAQLLFVLDDAPLEDVFDESLLVGYEHLGGWLAGGVDAWGRSGGELRRTATLDVRTARRQLADGVVALDVREPDEHDFGHIEGARHIPLGSLQEGAATLPKDRPLLVYCAHGDRASTAISVLERAGFESIASLAGGYEAWRREA
ncbi:MAG TPA: rhodanese-like domain-containing protein, partial [Dehalococcoidia bacterium]|nr:rhodanese-like domain-containing protein [Dehalococcoidia bacterium]